MGWAEPKREPARARSKGALCVIVRAETRPGADEEFAALLKDFTDQVRAEDHDCESYVVTRALGSRTQFAIHARFNGMRAFRRHAETQHFNRILPHMAALLARPVAMELFLAV